MSPAPAAKPPKVSFYLQVMQQVAAWRAQMARFLTTLPYWPELERVSLVVAGPVKAIARRTLSFLPALRKAEWLLEIETLTKRHPVGLAFSVCYTAWVGLMPSTFGHIATNITIYPFLGVVSGFNPFLGLLCAFAYGIADLVQKLLWNDIFGANSRFSLDYWGAMLGYVIAYSSLAIMGVLPGLTSRVSRYAMRVALNTLFFKRTAASADGALPGGSDPGYRMNFHDPQYKAAVHELQKDPRHLLDDSYAWENAKDLTPFQRVVLTQLRLQGLLGNDSAEQLDQLWLSDTQKPRSKKQQEFYEYCPPPQNPPIPSDFREPPGIDDSDFGDPPAPPAGSGGGGASTYPLAEMLAGMFGGMLGGAATMYFIAPVVEAPAFFLRPHRDDSCHQLEVSRYLRGMAPAGGLAGAAGGAGPDFAPPPGSAPPGSPPQDVNDFFDRWNRANAVNFNAGKDPWVDEQLNNMMQQFEKTGRIDPNGMDSIEHRLGAIDQSNAIQSAIDDNAAIDRSNAERDRRDASEAAENQKQRHLLDEYNRLLDRADNGGDLESRTGSDSLDRWHGRVIRDNGTVDPVQLERMRIALAMQKHNELQQDLNAADPGSSPTPGAEAGWRRLRQQMNAIDNPAAPPPPDNYVDSPDSPEQAALIKRYNQLVDQTNDGGNLDSQAARELLDKWHDRVVQKGVIDPAELQHMANALKLWKGNELRHETDLSSAVSNAENIAGSGFGVLESTARTIRNTAFAVDGALLTGGAGVAAGGGATGAIAAIGAGIGYGAGTGGINAMSDAASMDLKTFGDGAWEGAKHGGASALIGMPTGVAAHALGLNPWAASALVGGVVSKAQGGSFIQGAAEGVVTMGLSNAAGNAVNRGGWDGTDLRAADAFKHPVSPSQAPEPTPPDAVESRWGSPRSDPWGRPPARPGAPPAPRVDPITGTASPDRWGSPRGESWGRPPAEPAADKPVASTVPPEPTLESAPGPNARHTAAPAGASLDPNPEAMGERAPTETRETTSPLKNSWDRVRQEAVNAQGAADRAESQAGAAEFEAEHARQKAVQSGSADDWKNFKDLDSAAAAQRQTADTARNQAAEMRERWLDNDPYRAKWRATTAADGAAKVVAAKTSEYDNAQKQLDEIANRPHSPQNSQEYQAALENVKAKRNELGAAQKTAEAANARLESVTPREQQQMQEDIRQRDRLMQEIRDQGVPAPKDRDAHGNIIDRPPTEYRTAADATEIDRQFLDKPEGKRKIYRVQDLHAIDPDTGQPLEIAVDQRQIKHGPGDTLIYEAPSRPRMELVRDPKGNIVRDAEGRPVFKPAQDKAGNPEHTGGTPMPATESDVEMRLPSRSPKNVLGFQRPGKAGEPGLIVTGRHENVEAHEVGHDMAPLTYREAYPYREHPYLEEGLNEHFTQRLKGTATDVTAYPDNVGVIRKLDEATGSAALDLRQGDIAAAHRKIGEAIGASRVGAEKFGGDALNTISRAMNEAEAMKGAGDQAGARAKYREINEALDLMKAGRQDDARAAIRNLAGQAPPPLPGPPAGPPLNPLPIESHSGPPNPFENHPLEDLHNMEQYYRNAGDHETADLVKQAIDRRATGGGAAPTAPPHPAQPEPRRATAPPPSAPEPSPLAGWKPGIPLTTAQMDRIYNNYSIHDLLDLRAEALATGDIRLNAAVQKMLAAKGYQRPPDEFPYPSSGDAEHWVPPDRRAAPNLETTHDSPPANLDTTQDSTPLSRIHPADLPEPGGRIKDSQMDRLYRNYTVEDLVAAQQHALERGDFRTSSALQNVLAAKGYNPTVTPEDIPPRSEVGLARTADVERLAQRYTYEQLGAAERAARAAGDTRAADLLNVARIERRRFENGVGWESPSPPSPPPQGGEE